jgi:predicted transglutaminase-like cysteine proteinase
VRGFLRYLFPLAFCLLALSSGFAVAAGDSRHSIFGTEETYTPGIDHFYKWAGMLQRWQEAEAAALSFCVPGQNDHCMPREWLRLVALLRPLDLRTKLATVNTLINRYPYIPSEANWHEVNHWETPFEFLARSGQCQDYAITKYLLLREAGVPDAQLRLVVLRDDRQGADHAVLVAYVNGETLMLDNQLTDVVSTDRVPYYRPYYSINESGWWLHTPNPLSIATVAIK